jgi:hypothetical protein
LDPFSWRPHLGKVFPNSRSSFAKVRDVVRAIRDFVPQLPQIECDFVPQETK